ncbi:MAG: histidine kinase dimerization/phospho-acceptor domain-containing protein [Nannocystaceae bacterium]
MPPPPIAAAPHTWATRAQVRRVGTVFLRQRPLYVAPAVLASWVVCQAIAAPLQRAVVMLLSGALLAFFVVESVLARRRAMAPSWLWRSLVVTAIGLAGACVATGGLASPYVPLLLAPTVTAFAAFGRDRRSAVMLALLLAIALGLALLPAGWPLPPLPSPPREFMLAVTTVLAAALLRVSVAGLSDAHEDAGAALDRVRTELLTGASERAAALESMGAQVAHEIRNPLTAIRGLVDLLAGGATDERAQRRFEVVRGEVERIEGIVRDYLAFARPLSQLRPHRSR